jgi:hypothetical protein
MHADFVNWDSLEVQGFNYQYGPDRLDIDQVTARKLYARVIVEPDTSLNVSRVLAGPGATVVVPGAPGTTQRPTAVTAPREAAESPKPAPVLKKRRNRKGDGKERAPAHSGGASMPIVVKKIILKDSEADFSDLSLMPNFSAGIHKLEGSVLGISSAPGARAKIDLKGQVGPYSPVTVAGEANILSAALYTDIAMNFRNIELSTFNPYSGKFAGYNIAKGKLTTELHYKVDGRKLDAQHHINIDQLEFGEKTASKDAVSLPVKLAVALLKDRDGVINLDLPVTGSLDDPKFRLGPIIWKVFVNILEKAVTAPFALLGSLFGGGPDLQFVDFQPGTADLDAAAAGKAQNIAKALNGRPQLKIEIPIAVVGELDRPRLIELKFQKEIQEELAAAPPGKKSSAAAGFDQLDPGAQLDVLTKLYKKIIGSDPKFPESIDAIKTKSEKITAKNDFLNQALHEHVAVSDSDLKALGQQRAMNLQAALLTDSQIDPGRVFLVANDKAKNQAGQVRLELSLK